MGWRLLGLWMLIHPLFHTINNSTRLAVGSKLAIAPELLTPATPELLSPATSVRQIQNPSLEFADRPTQIAMWEKIQAPIPNRLSRPLRS